MDLLQQVHCPCFAPVGCRSKQTSVMHDVLGIYARGNAESGWCAGSAGPLPAHYQVVGRDVPWPDGWTAI
ncbi:hypothetical protein [Methylobacterium nodulans]|uniref:Uncharacterized protein n=1 Tax=Methylobacterium nodulans (strain LMG 21967 / CNCM I-2342 / ORS 2060) TaxID=460265 RepID=B8IV96_METNO|nr:hypothetical protein [Methylobacterium nodulans]ACL60947.1 hypothetical protein Mnod_6127 [Methylobacterium nodulans ORS 2060]